MESANSADAALGPASVTYCRGLLGDEAEELCDEELVRLLQNADAMARALVEIVLENCATSE